jgi:hypothetical protein
MNLKTARAWRIKEAAALLWNYTYMSAAEKNWKRLPYWISHCRLKPVSRWEYDPALFLGYTECDTTQSRQQYVRGKECRDSTDKEHRLRLP